MSADRDQRVLLTVSGNIPEDVEEQIAAGRRPRADYVELARAFDADLLDHHSSARDSGRIGRLLTRLAGPSAGLAWRCFSLRKRYDVVVTDGEQVGLALAAMSWLGRRSSRHVMITHVMSAPKKVWLFRLLALKRRIDHFVVYSGAQRTFIVDRLGVPADSVSLVSFMVDSTFFDPDLLANSRPRPMICAVGLEFRDYPTLLAAVTGLDADVVLAAASPWSKRRSGLEDEVLPPNVQVVRLDLQALRQLYADATLVVMPLVDVEFQAGVTTILEAMSMGKAVVCTRTRGQTDVIEDGVTGNYVPPADQDALHAAIRKLLDDPDERAALGRAARSWVVDHGDVLVYSNTLASIVDGCRPSKASVAR